MHALKHPPGRAASSMVQPDRPQSRPDHRPVFLDPAPDQRKERLRKAFDEWRRNENATRAQFADALGASEVSVKHWLSSDPERQPPTEAVTLAERLALESTAPLSDREIAEAFREWLRAEARISQIRERILEAA